MIKSFRLFMPFTGILLLAACSSTQDCNPDQSNFFSGIGCSVGGGYQNRTQNLQNQLSSEKQNATQQQQQAKQSYQQANQLQNDIAQRRNELSKIDSQAWSVRQKLQKAKTDHSMTSQEVKQKEKQLAAYNAKRAKVSADPSQQDINALSNILGNM
ncbi:hypothetical protein [Commensalibacter nepenthis]|uniref:Lipoprotein n=1 Tax=Commensalibacter nepenthis TaxID=3043872 RepID=A0ABT6Q4T4_9PROT|nr:hypothetical protein [Commensalibacter sp. TBRC 10068]MDI2111906.1 hypothetical protein [Commensalibacter sp. TBRC 10068]